MSVSTGRWTRYGRMADHVLPAAQHALDLVGPPTTNGRVDPRLLDVGSGSGALLPFARAAGWTPVGLDRSNDQLGLAVDADPLNLLVHADAQRLPVADRSVQGAVSNFALIFASDPVAVLSEVLRCLDPGSRFAWTSWCPGGWPAVWRAIVASAIGEPPNEFPVALGAESVARRAMQRTGFVDVTASMGALRWEFPDARAAVDVMSNAAGGIRLVRTKLERDGAWGDVARDLVADVEQRMVTVPGGIAIDDRYLLVAGARAAR